MVQVHHVPLKLSLPSKSAGSFCRTSVARSSEKQFLGMDPSTQPRDALKVSRGIFYLLGKVLLSSVLFHAYTRSKHTCYSSTNSTTFSSSGYHPRWLHESPSIRSDSHLARASHWHLHPRFTYSMSRSSSASQFLDHRSGSTSETCSPCA